MYNIFTFRKSFKFCLSLISYSIKVETNKELISSRCLFSHTLIVKAFCVLDPMFNSGVVSCGLWMITIVCAHCYLIGLFLMFKFSSLLCEGFVTFFPTILCVFFVLI